MDSEILTLKTVTGREFERALTNMYKFQQINPDRYKGYQILHQGDETFQQLSQNCVIEPTDEEKHSVEYMEVLESIGLEVSNALRCDKIDFDASDSHNKQLQLVKNKRKIMEVDSDDEDDIMASQSNAGHSLISSEIKEESSTKDCSPVKNPECIASIRKRMDRSFEKRKEMLITGYVLEIIRKYPGFRYLAVVKDEYNRITSDANRINSLDDKLCRRFDKLLRVDPSQNPHLQSVLDKYTSIREPNQDSKKTAATLMLCISLCGSIESLITFQDNSADVIVSNEILYPKMTVVGDPFNNCQVIVFTDNIPILELKNVYDGLIAVYCLFYIFDIAYGRRVKKLMEYLDFLVGLDQTSFSSDVFKMGK